MDPTTTIPIVIKWGKESLSYDFCPAAGVKHWKQELEERTGVPADRVKLMAKGLWKGVLKDDFDLTSIDWSAAQHRTPQISVVLMGSATRLVAPAQKTVFVEDLPPEQAAILHEPSGLVNLGNTCYMNSVVQCLRAIPKLRQSLVNVRGQPQNQAHGLLVASLRDTLVRLDQQSTALQPVALLQAIRVVFPQFNQRGPHGQPMQQDAEEFFSGLLAAATSELTLSNVSQESLLESELQGAQNWVDVLFGLKMKETLTCDEVTDETQEPPVISYDLHRKLVCNIQGGSDTLSNTNVGHVAEGIQLGLTGKIEKQSDVLGRNAMWTRTQRIARLPPVITVQFGRFYWKATPDSQDHSGGKSLLRL